ncbi:hypothetical protein BDZ90DRAFT_212529, partial [Jaminaea rosea]
LLSLPPEILDLIALYTGLASQTPISSSPTPPQALLDLLLVCRQIHAHLAPANNPRLYARIFRSKFDTEAICRRFGRKAVSSRVLCDELQRRCIILKRIRHATELGRLRPEGPGEASDAAMRENLWLAYLLCTENDGLNVAALQWANIKEYLSLHHTQEMLESALEPGYPPESEDRALALHIGYLIKDPAELTQESKDEVEEKLFILRPFVFASHKFECFYAPWTLRSLPIRRAEEPGEAMEEVERERHEAAGQSRAGSVRGSPAQPANPFLADLAPKVRTTVLYHCGQRLTLRPPVLAHAAYFSFFNQVECDPAVVGLQAILGLLHPSLSAGRVGEETTVLEQPGYIPGGPIHSLSSAEHDRDLARLVACHDPYRSPGLKPCFFAGQLEGAWEGRFSFFDFDSYREMLAGRMQSLYEGPFGEQPQVWKLKEHFVRVGEGSGYKEGGHAGVISAGFGAEDPMEDRARELDAKEAAGLQGGSSAGLSAKAKGKGKRYGDDYDEQPASKDVGLSTDRYEMLISGIGHSAWGRFVLRGRVRAWDGMVILSKEYRPDGRGRWLYRGYALAGAALVGRWRDSFTPREMSGYEGPFVLRKR